MCAVGRNADSEKLGLKELGIKLHSSGKILANEDDTTNFSNIFAIGDVCYGRLELTPTAIKAGRLLAARLFNQKKQLMDYKFVPTTVFTPIEYGCLGFSEEDAIKKWGEKELKIY